MHQPEHEQADELERYFSPPGYAYAPHETADLPLESTRRYDPRMQAPPQHEQSMGYHQPPGASSGSSRSRLSAPAPCLYYPSSPDHPQYAGHPEQHYAPDRSQGMQVSSPYWPAIHSRPQAVPADRLPSRLSYYQPSEYCYAPPQPAEPWSWPQHAHSGGQADPGARSTPASERSNSGRASSKLPHMQPAIPASYERRASQPKQGGLLSAHTAAVPMLHKAEHALYSPMRHQSLLVRSGGPHATVMMTVLHSAGTWSTMSSSNTNIDPQSPHLQGRQLQTVLCRSKNPGAVAGPDLPAGICRDLPLLQDPSAQWALRGAWYQWPACHPSPGLPAVT